MHIVPEQGEEAGKQLEHRVPRRMADFEFVGRGYELAAIPIGGGGLDGQQIGPCRHDEGDGSAYPVPQGEFLAIHNLQRYN